MALNWIVDDTTNLIVGAVEGDYTAPAGQSVVAASTIEAAASVPVRQSGTWDGTTYTAPTTGIATVAEAHKKRLWHAYIRGTEHHRRSSWSSLQTAGANADRPMRALDRWVYQQVALADLAADGTWPSSASADDIERIVSKVEAAITLSAELWYRVMAGDTAKATSWAASGVADGSPIYSDLFTTTGADRTMDGTFQLIAGATIPTSFWPEHPNLRIPS